MTAREKELRQQFYDAYALQRGYSQAALALKARDAIFFPKPKKASKK